MIMLSSIWDGSFTLQDQLYTYSYRIYVVLVKYQYEKKKMLPSYTDLKGPTLRGSVGGRDQ